jgi:hypothetical protein
MSVFPKRTVRGSAVTIHCAVNLDRLVRDFGFPVLRLLVTDPAGTAVVVLERQLLGVPTRPGGAAPPSPEVPLLSVMGRLEGSLDGAGAADLLDSVRHGIHHFAVFPVSTTAPLGKYAFTIEVCIDGAVVRSLTEATDHFMVEEITLRAAGDSPRTPYAVVHNPGPDPVPVTVVLLPCGGTSGAERYETQLPPEADTALRVNACCSYLMYSEGREVLPLFDPAVQHLLRNSRISGIRRDGALYLVSRDSGEVHQLVHDAAVSVWGRANGLLRRDMLTEGEGEALDTLRAGGYVVEVTFP